MSKNGQNGARGGGTSPPPGDDEKYKGCLRGPAPHVVLQREVWSYPPEEQAERLAAFAHKQRLETEEDARRWLDGLIAEAALR